MNTNVTTCNMATNAINNDSYLKIMHFRQPPDSARGQKRQGLAGIDTF